MHQLDGLPTLIFFSAQALPSLSFLGLSWFLPLGLFLLSVLAQLLTGP